MRETNDTIDSFIVCSIIEVCMCVCMCMCVYACAGACVCVCTVCVLYEHVWVGKRGEGVGGSDFRVFRGSNEHSPSLGGPVMWLQ